MNQMQKNTMLLMLGLFGVSMIGQSLGLFNLSGHYHEFVDTRNIFGMSRFFDTVSNIGFLFVGVIFIKEILLQNKKDFNLMLIAVGSILVFFGSSFYHLFPSDARLLWDRLPISMVFAGILSYSLSANNLIIEKYKNKFDISYLMFSIFSVVFWYVGSLQQASWLGPYVFVQFGGMITLVYIAIKGENKDFNKKIYYVLAWYILAKLCEHFDQSIFNITYEMFSGHTLKHLLAAVALYCWFPKENTEKLITSKTLKLGLWQLVYK